jgi:hypothetical protein
MDGGRMDEEARKAELRTIGCCVYAASNRAHLHTLLQAAGPRTTRLRELHEYEQRRKAAAAGDATAAAEAAAAEAAVAAETAAPR